jgi:hypothetical protein
MCFQLNLVLKKIHIINSSSNRKLLYSFLYCLLLKERRMDGRKSLTIPFITSLYNDWYKSIKNKNVNVLPLNLDYLFTPLAISFLIMGA